MRFGKSATNLRREKLARKLAAYSMATGTSILAIDTADAAVVPFPLSFPITYDVSLGSVHEVFDLNGDQVNDFYFDGYYFGTLVSSGYLASNGTLVTGVGHSTANLLSPGALIGPSGDFNRHAYYDLFSQTRGYVGLVFDIPGGSPHYGYLDLGISGPGNTVITFYGGAYESIANTPILAGAVPEPTSLMLLAGGVATLATWRKRN